jgi:hypothetical protein
LDLHFEHRDALDVERGSWRLADHLSGFARLRVRVSDHELGGEILGVGRDWVHLSNAVVCLDACDALQPSGSGAASTTVLDFRQAVRHLAGKVPREMVLRNGLSQLVTIEWVARDFLQARGTSGRMLIPLAQVAVIFGRVEIG